MSRGFLCLGVETAVKFVTRVDAELMIFGKDWVSAETLAGERDPDASVTITLHRFLQSFRDVRWHSDDGCHLQITAEGVR